MPLTILDHPLAADLLSVLRDRDTEPPEFRQITERLGYLLVAEALADMSTVEVEIETPLERTSGLQLRRPVVAVAVLRAGLGLLESVLTLVPDAAIGWRDVRAAAAPAPAARFVGCGGTFSVGGIEGTPAAPSKLSFGAHVLPAPPRSPPARRPPRRPQAASPGGPAASAP